MLGGWVGGWQVLLERKRRQHWRWALITGSRLACPVLHTHVHVQLGPDGGGADLVGGQVEQLVLEGVWWHST